MYEELSLLLLQVENIKGIKLAYLKLSGDGEAIVVSGPNEAGKSTLLDGVEYTLRGKSVSAEPVRRGEKKGRAFIVLGKDGVTKYEITRFFTEKADRLYIRRFGSDTGEKGKKVESPQTVLDSFKADLTFDPGAFAKATDLEQRAMLMKVSDFKFDLNKLCKIAHFQNKIFDKVSDPFVLIDMVTKEVKEFRKQANISLKYTKAVFKKFENAKEFLSVDVGMLLNKRKELERKAAEKQKEIILITQLRSVETSLRDHFEMNSRQIKELETKVTALKTENVSLEDKILTQTEKIQIQKEHFDNLPVYTFDEIDQKLEEAEQINEDARIYKEKLFAEKEVEVKTTIYNEADRVVKEVENYQKELLKNATFPVQGLGINKNMVITLEDVPLSQRGDSKKILVGMTIAAALNPNIKTILIRNGSEFDSPTLVKIATWAKSKGFQVIIEKVADAPDGDSFYLEEGLVRSEPKREKSQKNLGL